MTKFLLALPPLAAAALANASPLPTYPTPGTVNPADHSFTAAATGPVVAYFGGHSAGFTSVLASSSTRSISGSPASATRRRRSAPRSILAG